MRNVHKIAGLRISRVESPVSRIGHLPDLEPPETKLRRNKSRIFSSDSIALSYDGESEDVFAQEVREEAHDFTARMTVYVLNLIVMIFVLPLGLLLLAFNVLAGENLRTTAHVMALTGMFMALGHAGAPFVALGL